MQIPIQVPIQIPIPQTAHQHTSQQQHASQQQQQQQQVHQQQQHQQHQQHQLARQLQVAIRARNVQDVQRLLDAKADVTTLCGSLSAMHSAATFGNVEILKMGNKKIWLQLFDLLLLLL